MNPAYSDYLKSKAWQRKRNKRLALAKFRCAACGSKQCLHVHHLTYARIFNEEMADLLPLCDLHHYAVEGLVASGLLPRTENVLFLATETVRLITLNCPSAPVAELIKPPAPPICEARNAVQDELLEQPWFIDLLRLQRDVFKRRIRSHLCDHPRREKFLANAFKLYDRPKTKHFYTTIHI